MRPDCKMTDKDIIAHCQKYIASYKKPKKVFFLDELPHTGVGKIQKVILKELLMKKSKVM